MDSLLLLERPMSTESFAANITDIAQGWQRISQAIGGYWRGSFRLSSRDLSRNDLTDFYDSNIGCIVQEYCAGMLSWEGIIEEMRLIVDGIEYMRSLRPEWWHNRVKVLFHTLSGRRTETTWSENTDASDEYGEMQQLVSAGAMTTTAGDALRDRHLAEFAWPRSRMVGGLAFGAERERLAGETLAVIVAGFWHTMGWRYQETSISDQCDNLITTLVGNSEFVTAGRIETNTMATHVDVSANPQRLTDLIEGIVELGNASANVWKAGVYAERELVYEQAPTVVDYYMCNGRLLDKVGVKVLPPLVEPGFLLEVPYSLLRSQPPGTSSIWDSPSVAYVEEVEYIAPDGLRLKLHGESETLAVIMRQIERGMR